ncbi:M28 family peptidase [Natronincola ferrireducens]|uniref:PA domain-containing protein n=1 Tax=Natronincola ferrireducens TaxID=393762 RepID=A0A1G8YLK4_9FIRM|nr:M28 family peptidase [Natronincola ferrireducens]SDK03547.1 PA domain-containing protein [Natronincola ferrireducens]
MDKYFKKADVDYAYNIALKLNDFVNSDLGGRNSGSDAEHEAAEYLYREMKEIGLQEVSKDSFPVARWQFNGGSLQIVNKGDDTKKINIYSYASSGTPKEGITAELVYVGKGRKKDYLYKDVKGKIVLIDINMREDWWVTYPTLEAAHQGAIAIINNCCGGYGEISEDAMNCQDFVGPITIPSVNISQKDANYLKTALEKQQILVNLRVDNQVNPNGVSYNIVGKIPGVIKDEYIIVGDHYDCHFWGFQDNNAAVGLTLAIAKAMIESNYKPNRTIIFILHGSEESGAIDTRYDWCIGAWNQINRVQPEWRGKTLAYINFELPAYDFGNSAYIASTPEFYSFLQEFVKRTSLEDHCFKNDRLEAGYPQFSWSDDWSYTIAGVPSLINGFLMNKQGEVSDFYYNIYHSQFDTKDTYNKEVLEFHIKLYGELAIKLDKTPIVALDFTHQAIRLKKSIDEEIWEIAGCDVEAFLMEIEAFHQIAEEKYREIKAMNEDYKDILEPHLQVINSQLLKVFQFFQDNLLRLDWYEVPIVGHQQPQNNINIMKKAIEKLKQKDVKFVLEELLLKVEDEWYSYHFSKEVLQHFTNQVMNPKNASNLYWGRGRVVGCVDLYDVIQSLQEKYTNGDLDFTREITYLEKVLEDQKQLLTKLIKEETDAIKEVKNILSNIGGFAVLEEL